MKAWIVSDLHREQYRLAGQEHHLTPPKEADIAIIAGDVDEGTQGIEWATGLNLPVVYVPGNREFYADEFHATKILMREAARDTNVHLLMNDYILIDDVALFGATLWTDFALRGIENRPQEMANCRSGTGSFKYIRIGEDRRIFEPEDSVSEFEISKQWMLDTIPSAQCRKRVMISHHLPHENSIDPIFKGSSLSSCYASDCTELMSDLAIDVWVHGHTHGPIEYELGGTRIICNPSGHKPGKPSPGFRPDLVIDL